MESNTRSVDELCTVWWPRASSLAFLLTGDRERSSRIAKRAVARAVAHWRDLRNPYALEAWFNKTVVAMSLRAHFLDSMLRRNRLPEVPDGLNPISRRLWQEVHNLRFKSRAAVVLVHFLAANDSQTADALGTSVAGAHSLVSNGVETIGARVGSDVVDAELAEVLQTLVSRTQGRSTRLDDFCRRVRAARAIGVLEAVAVVVAITVGAYATGSSLRRDGSDDRGPQVVELDDDADRADTLQIGGAPGWCPGPRGLEKLPDVLVDGRTGIGLTFVVALTKRYEDGIRRYTDSVMLRVAANRGPHPSEWPRLGSVSRLRILHQGPGTYDIALQRACGSVVAARTWIIVYEDFTDPEIDQLAIYMLQRAGEWKVWGTFKPALIL